MSQLEGLTFGLDPSVSKPKSIIHAIGKRRGKVTDMGDYVDFLLSENVDSEACRVTILRGISILRAGAFLRALEDGKEALLRDPSLYLHAAPVLPQVNEYAASLHAHVGLALVTVVALYLLVILSHRALGGIVSLVIAVIAPVPGIILWRRYRSGIRVVRHTRAAEYHFRNPDAAPKSLFVDQRALSCIRAVTHLRGAGQRVAIIGTGIDAKHPALAGLRIRESKVFMKSPSDDHNRHGTQMASIICSVAPDAELLIAKVLGDDGHGEEFDIAKAVVWATTHCATVICLGVGMEGEGPLLESAIRAAMDQGVVVVCSVGNTPGTCGSPGRMTEVITVGACLNDGTVAQFSGWSMDPPKPDLLAPGVKIKCAIPGNGFAESSGTTMAAGYVTGAVLLLAEHEVNLRGSLFDPKARPARFKRQLADGARQVVSRSISQGYGVLDLQKALSLSNGAGQEHKGISDSRAFVSDGNGSPRTHDSITLTVPTNEQKSTASGTPDKYPFVKFTLIYEQDAKEGNSLRLVPEVTTNAANLRVRIFATFKVDGEKHEDFEFSWPKPNSRWFYTRNAKKNGGNYAVEVTVKEASISVDGVRFSG